MDKHKRKTSAQGRAATIQDVALLAGVSTASVSRYIHSSGNVSSTTGESIKRAVESLNYIPNFAARSLSGLPTKAVYLIVPSLSNPVFSEAFSATREILRKSGLSLFASESNFSLSLERQLVEAAVQRRAEGVILLGCKHDSRATELLKNSGSIVVETWSLSDESSFLNIGFDNISAGKELAIHLLKKGCKKLAFISPCRQGSDRMAHRFDGFREAMEEYGIPLKDWCVFDAEGLSMGEGARIFERILKEMPQVEGCLFASDALASGAILAASRLGVKIPQNIRVVGIDNMEISSLLSPSLTTVQIEGERLGEWVGNMILQRLGSLPEAEAQFLSDSIAQGHETTDRNSIILTTGETITFLGTERTLEKIKQVELSFNLIERESSQ